MCSHLNIQLSISEDSAVASDASIDLILHTTAQVIKHMPTGKIRNRKLMKIQKIALTFTVLSLISIAGVRAQDTSAPYSIPLHEFQFTNANGYVQTDYTIDVGVNGGAPRPYLFDTGSSVFEAVVGNSPYDLSPPVPGVTPVATNFQYSYETGDGFEGTLVDTSVSFYATLDTNSFITNLTTAAGSTNGILVNAISNHLISNAVDTNYWPSIETNGAPIYDTLAGTFGAGTFLSSTTNGIIGTATNLTYGGVLGQITTSGYIVSLNSSNASVTVGLNSTLINQFTNIVSANPSTNPNALVFPGSGTASFDEKELNVNETISGSNTVNGHNDLTTNSTSVLLDTGTGNLNTTNDYANFYSNSDHIIPGNNFSVVSTNGSSILSVTTTTPDQDLSTSVSSSERTLGIAVFLTNSVLYNLQDTNLGFTTAAVNAESVPEPSTYILFGLGALSLVIASRQKFSFRRLKLAKSKSHQ